MSTTLTLCSSFLSPAEAVRLVRIELKGDEHLWIPLKRPVSAYASPDAAIFLLSPVDCPLTKRIRVNAAVEILTLLEFPDLAVAPLGEIGSSAVLPWERRSYARHG